MVDHINEIRSTIVDEPPFYASTHTIPADNLLTKFSFLKDGDMCYVDLLNLSELDIQLLSDACDPATFGLHNKDVLDPSYRKALKMDKEKFCTNFELRQKQIGMDIISEIENELWYGEDGAGGVIILRPEIYKLNVYGMDSFFKKHKDTPRGVDMVGSLVVAFPTPECEGGELVLSKDDKSWTWDSAKILKEAPERTIAYVAFYSDTDHEVLPVTKGNRVTITYNLYSEPDNGDLATLEPATIPTPEEEAFKTALSNALSDPDFLPKGGYLAFGLLHLYAVDPEKTELGTIKNLLKGSDAMIKRVCEHLGLEVELNAVYQDVQYDGYNTADFVVGKFLDSEDLNQEDADPIYRSGKMLVEIDNKGDVLDPELVKEYTKFGKHRPMMPVLWITEPVDDTGTEFGTPHICYGNEHSIGYVYAYICLMAKVERGKVIPQKRRKHD